MHRGPPDKLPTESTESERQKRTRDSSLEDSKFASPEEDPMRPARRPRIEDTSHSDDESSFSDEVPEAREQGRAESQGSLAASTRPPFLDPATAHAAAGLVPQGGANAGAYHQALLARQLASMTSVQPGFNLRGGMSAATFGTPPSLGLSSSLLLLERQREEREQLLQEMAATRAAERLLASRSGAAQPSSPHVPGGAGSGVPSPYTTTGGFPLSSTATGLQIAPMDFGATYATTGIVAPSTIVLGAPSNADLFSDLFSRSSQGAARGFRSADAALLASGEGNPLAAARRGETTVERGLDWRTRRFLGLPPVPDEMELGGLMTGHPPEDLYMECDEEVLSDHQVLLRKQIEFFEAGPNDLLCMGSGRRRDIAVGQVGIRCKHCAHLPAHLRPRGSMYFPASLRALYQAAQNMGVAHFVSACGMINEQTRQELIEFQSAKNKAGHAGKKWWADGARARGVMETESEGLRFVSPAAAPAVEAASSGQPSGQQGETV
jgi:hypothetical protein